MLIKKYYYSLEDINSVVLSATSVSPFNADDLKDVIADLGLTTQLGNLPFATDNTYVEQLWQGVIARYFNEYLFNIKKCLNDEPTSSEVTNAFIKWLYKFFNFVALRYDYYVTLLGFYASNKSHLMDDIEATSSNMIKYNDTPQNANTNGVYEGDDYISNFTKTEGTSSSPLTSKINRLKEIQDAYKNTMSDWIKEAEQLFIEGANL